MIISEQALAHRSEYLALERSASEAYLKFVHDDSKDADRIRERMFDADVGEFSPTFGRILVDDGQVLGMISCLRGVEATRSRMRAAMFLMRSGLLQNRAETQGRMEQAARTLIKLRADDFYLSRIAVSHASSGTGASKHLMDYCESKARDSGSARICLEVSQDNERAIAFYRRCMFEPFEVRSVTERSGRTLSYVHMAKALG